MREELILDVDGVLAQFHEKSLVTMKELWGYDIPLEKAVEWDVSLLLDTQEQRDRFNEVIAMPGWSASLLPYPAAQAAIKELRRRGVPILFATAPMGHSETWMRERSLWLIRHFDAAEEEIAHIHRKASLSAHAFVDDKPVTVRRWAERNPSKHAVLWDAVYNRTVTDLRRSSSWSEILSLFPA